MARLNRKGEMWSHLTEFGVFRDAAGGGSSTVTGAIPSVDTASPVLNVVSGTNFVAQDYFRVRDGNDRPEVNRVASIAVNAITCAYPFLFLPATSEAVVELAKTSLGHIADDGVNIAFSGSETSVAAANRRLQLAYLTGNGEVKVTVSALGLNLENLATALGVLESRVSGSGTSGAPYKLNLDGTQFKEQNDLTWYVSGVRKDGVTEEIHFAGCEVDWSGLAQAFGRGAPALVPISFHVTSMIRFIEV